MYSYRVLFYCEVFYPEETGYSLAFQNLIKAVVKYNQNIHIDVLTPTILQNNKEIEIPNVKIIRLNTILKIKYIRTVINSLLWARILTRQFNKNKYDAVFIETFDDAILLSLLPKYIYRILVVRIHSTSETEYTIFFPGLLNKLRKILITKIISKKIKYIVSTNSYHVKFFKKYFLKNNLFEICQKTFFIIPNTLVEKETVLSNKILSDQNIDTKRRIILLGRMDKAGFLQKGFGDFIEAVIILKDFLLEIINEVEISVIGSGEYQKSFEKRIKNIGLLQVKFIEKLTNEEILKLMTKADIIVLPSRFEGLSMFALEALYTSNAVLFSETGGLVDLVSNNGLFFIPQNIQDLAVQLRKMLSLPKNELEIMKANSKKVYWNGFSNEAVSSEFMKLLSIVSHNFRN